jgi:GNAT superfamily N-acetyltransferase
MDSVPVDPTGFRIVRYPDVAPADRSRWIGRTYDDVLRPNFPPNELTPWPAFADMVSQESPTTHVVAACTPDDQHLGCIVGHWFRSARVLLISYLAVSAESRSQGVGTALVQAAIPSWAAELGPDAVVAEVEDPQRFVGMRGQDPVRRLRLYARLGARLVDTPYVQPEVNPGAGRVSGMLLVVAPAVSAGVVTLAGGQPALPSGVITTFLTEYFSSTEGPGYDDAQFRALVGSASSRAMLPLPPLPV